MKFTITITQGDRQKTAALSTEAKIAQICCPQLFTFSEDLPLQTPGGLFFHRAQSDQLAKQWNRFAAPLAIAPLVATDMENGPGAMISDGTEFPPMLAAGVAGDAQLAYQMGKAAAIEGGVLGFNWSLSPCVDILQNPASPMVSLRSAGQSARQVISIAGEVMRGMQDHGMMATLKHFPGDGRDVVDQHVTVACHDANKDDYLDNQGRVFKTLIDQGAMAVMPGHISLPAFDKPDPKTGLYPPASISPRLLTDLLRDKFQFDGLVVSDAVNMGGFGGVINRFDATARFLEAGGDMVLFPHVHAIIPEMMKRLDQGMLQERTLDNRVARILALKRIWCGRPRPTSDESNLADARNAAATMTQQAVVVARDRIGLLPFTIANGDRVAHVVIAEQPDEQTLLTTLGDALAQTGATVETIIESYPEPIFERIYRESFDLIICSVSSRPNWGTGRIALGGVATRLLMTGWMRLGVPTLFVAHGHPFFHQQFPYLADTVINTNGSIAATMNQVVRIIVGQSPARPNPLN